MEHKDLWQKALFLIRSRTAETTVAKVKAHLGIHSNEEADRLAKAGAESLNEDFPDTEVPTRWLLGGVKLSSLVHSQVYEWIRQSEPKSTKTRALENVPRILTELKQTHSVVVTEREVWLSLRKPYIRREISDFLWTMVHGRSPCGTMFSKWGPGWEDLQFCTCGAVESMEHILTECGDAVWRIRLWRKVSRILTDSKIIPTELCRPPSFTEIMGVGLVKLRNAAATRLWATVISEAFFVIWKLRNRARFDNVDIPYAMARNHLITALEKRARTDLAALKLKGVPTADEDKRRKEAATAWGSLVSIKGPALVWSSADYG